MPPVSVWIIALHALLGGAISLSAQVADIGDRLELFVDDAMVASLKGDARRVLHRPEPREVVFSLDAAWEGTTSAYYTLFADGDRFRMYYRGSTLEAKDPPKTRKEVTCLAESEDGIHWTRPVLNLFEWEGSHENNIVWMGEDTAAHNMAVFKDTNPSAPGGERYKALGQKRGPRAYKSADGVKWSLVADRPLVTKGTFDSQNIAFWDSVREEYRLYWRWNPKAEGGLSIRSIRTATSKDFRNWENQRDLEYPGKPEPKEWKEAVQLYTSAIFPYPRAPHLLIGFPTQFLNKGYATQPLFMCSRDGVRFARWDEPVIPTTAPQDRSGNRSNYMAWGMLQLPGKPGELSVYASENSRGKGPPRLRRFVYRVDGFVSIRAGADGGEVVTPPLRFSGDRLVLNYETREGGSLKAELHDSGGAPLEGYRFEDCEPLTGDSVNAMVRWRDKGSKLPGQPLRIRFVFTNADLYSFKTEFSHQP